MKTTLTFALALILTNFLVFSTIAQNKLKPYKLNKNSFQVTLGGAPMVLENQLSLMYERSLFINQKKSVVWSAQILYASPIGDEERYFSTRLTALIGRKWVKLELSAGWMWYSYDWGDARYSANHFAPVIAIRLQKFNEPFIFRIGAGAPEGAFIGIGLSF